MNDWLSIPVKTRIDLLREYKINGIGYTQAKKDFLNSYKNGGIIEQPSTWDNIKSALNPKNWGVS